MRPKRVLVTGSAGFISSNFIRHMLRETPRLFFMHFWGLGDPTRIAEGLKAALAKVAVQ